MDAYVTELLFGGFLLLLILGAPITVALGGAGMAAYVVLDKDPIALVCARRPNSDHPCRLNIDQGWKPVSIEAGCG